MAWTLNGTVPPTLPDRADDHWRPNPVRVPVNPATGLRVEADCPVADPEIREIAQWPRAAGPWLSPDQRRQSRIPPLDPVCGRPVAAAADSIRIRGLEPDALIRPPGSRRRLPEIALQAEGGRGELFWMLNGDLVARCGVGEVRNLRFDRPGRYRLTVMDLAGNYDAVSFVVMAGRRGSG